MVTISKNLYYYKIQKGDTLQDLAKRYNTTVNSILAANPWINPNYLCVGQIIAIYTGNYIPKNNNYNRINNCIPQSVVALRDTMRMLWEQHLHWTRDAVIAIIQDAPDRELIVNRLLKNPDDIANALRTYYGDEVAQAFSSLLKDHLVIAAELVNAAKAGDTTTATDAEKRWYENADQIATFLNSINPYWPKRDVLAMFHEHLSLTKDEAVFRLNKEYAEDIALYDEMQAQILGMADMFSNGIVMQFPNKFSN